MRHQICVMAILISAGSVMASDPTLTVIVPRGLQRGTERQLTFYGARLKDAEEIFFYEPGLEVVKITPDEKNANRVHAIVKVASDCALGEKTAQIRTKSGISDYRTLFVGALPQVSEKEPNTEFGQAQPVDMNSTVEGVILPEDVDYFSIEAKKGQRLSVEVEGMRFGQTLFDPYIAILNDQRFELSAVDDSPLVRQDAVTSIVVPEDGRYIIEVRESGYGGNRNCRYRLHVGDFPRPTAVFPAGGRAGEEVEFTFLGDADGPMTRTVKLPADGRTEVTIFAEDDRGISPSGHLVRVSDRANVFETEPNDSLNDATPARFPAALNGVLATAGDRDIFKFAAKKGQTYEVECYGRRIRSGIDPVMHIYNLKTRKSIAGNDDARGGPDSYIRFKVPEDGEYAVRVMDHLNRGGEDFVYRVEFQPVSPQLTLGIPRVARYSQNRQRIYVAQGNRFGTIISANRQNFGGELKLEDMQLPEGIRIIAQPMPSNLNTMPVIFEATQNAARGGTLVDFRARLNDDKKSISGRFENRADFVIDQPGQSLYAWKDVSRLAVAVVDELPFSLEIVEPKVPIVRNGSMQLKVVAKKKEGWDEQITVQFPFRSPGVGANTSVKMPKGKTELLYPVSANGKAAPGKWPVYVIGSANVRGAAWAASQMATLEVTEPWVGIALQRTTVELGQATEIVANIKVLKKLTAPAQVRLLGLPHKVTADPLEITNETTKLTFKVQTQPDSPAGMHKNIFCQVVVTENGEAITHRRIGYTQLRIDKPLPKPDTASPDNKSAAAKPADRATGKGAQS